MKKVLVFLLTLGFAASAFALDLGNGLTLSGEVTTGFRVDSVDDGVSATDDTSVHYGNGDQAVLGQLTFEYTADRGGVKLVLKSAHKPKADAAELDDGAFQIPTAVGYVNLFGGKVVITGGKDIGDKWGLGKLHANAFDPSLDGVNGLRAAFNVVDGLSFGIALPLDPIKYKDYDGSSDYDIKTADRKIGHFLGGVVLGALYTSDLFSGAAGVRLYPEIDSKVYGGTPNGAEYPKDKAYADIIAGISAQPVTGLKVGLSSRFDTRKFTQDTVIQDKSKIGYSRIGLKAAYETGALSFGVNGDATIQNDKADDTGKIDGVTVDKTNYERDTTVKTPGDMIINFGGSVAYKLNETVKGTIEFGSDNLNYFEGNGLYVKPIVDLSLGMASIGINDKISMIGADKLKNAKNEEYSQVKNELQVQVSFKF
jgi:hypothetical protein